MAKWTKSSGVASYEPMACQYFHERTRKWYVRFERVAATDYLTVKVYAVLSDATAGNSNYSGTASLAVTDHMLRFVLAVGNVAPSLAGAVLHVKIPGTSLSTAIGTAVWQVDLGKKIERAMLWLLRAVSKVTTTNGYFTTFTRVERGVRTYEDAAGLLPYFGVAMITIRSEPATLGGAQAGSLVTALDMRCVAYDANVVVGAEVLDTDMAFVWHDLRRAFRAAYTEVFAGLVDDGGIVADWSMTAGEPDLGMSWAREKGALEYLVTIKIDEPGTSEVGTG